MGVTRSWRKFLEGWSKTATTEASAGRQFAKSEYIYVSAIEQHGPHKEQPLYRNVQRFREGLVFEAHRLLYHSTLGLRGIQKKKKEHSKTVMTVIR